MKVEMNKLTEALKEMNLDAKYTMSGGNTGTIYIGQADTNGNYEFAIGPSDYSTATGDTDELCWGIDGFDVALQGNEADTSSLPNLALRIALDYLTSYGSRV